MKSVNNESLKVILGKFESGDLWYQDGQVYRKSTGRAITSKGGRGNYIRIEVSVNGKLHRAYAHRVIFALHHGLDKLEEYEVIDHRDEDVYNNRIENLRGFTCKQNTIQRYVNQDRGKKLSMDEVRSIKVLLDDGVLQKVIAEVYGVSPTHISRIKTGGHYSYIESPK